MKTTRKSSGTWILMLAVMAIAVFTPAAASAAAITINNHSFETDALTATINNTMAITGWTRMAGNEYLADRNGGNMQTYVKATPDTDGEQFILTAGSNGGVYQETSEEMSAGTVYTLTVDMGDRSNQPFPSFDLRLGTGSTLGANLLTATVVSNTTPDYTVGDGWETWVYTFTEGGGVPGQNVRVELFQTATTSGQACFDNVRLEAVPLPTDITPPALTNTIPADGASSVAVGDNLVATFDEDIALTGSGSIVITNLTTPANSITISLPDGAQVSVSTSNLTINPSSDLDTSSDYAVRISADAIEDQATSPNAFGGISDNTTWNFTTVSESTPPEISSTSPADNATDVAESASLVATFSESIAVGTGNILITNLTDSVGTVIPVGDAQVQISGTTLTIDPVAGLDAGVDYAVRIDAGAVEDLVGNPFGGIADNTTWNFTMVADTTAPTISSTTPVDGAVDVVWDADLVATFDEDIAAGTGNIIITNLTDNTGTVIPVGDAQVTIVGATLTINPTASLDLGDDYAVRIDAGAIVDQAASPNAFAGIADNTTWNFTVASSIPITIANHSFETDALTATINNTMAITGWTRMAGNEYLADRNGGNMQTYVKATPDTDGEQFILTAGSNGGVYQETSEEMSAGTVYTLTVDMGDRSNQPFPSFDLRLGTGSTLGANLLTATVVSNTTPDYTVGDGWETWVYTFTEGGGVPGQNVRVELFQTATTSGQACFDNVRLEAVPLPTDITPPALTNTIPADGASSVAVGDNLVATFDEDIALTGSGSIVITNLTTPANSITISLPDGAQVSVSTSNLTINPSSDLDTSSDYAVRISADAIEDQATSPNAFGGISDNTTWNFTTVSESTPPEISSTSPADNATDVAESASLVATFSESIAVGTGNILITNLTDSVGTVIPVGDAQVQISGTTLTIDPVAGLDAGVDYAVRIDAGAVEDLVGNPFGGIADNTTWNFTMVADTTAPTISSTTPVDGAVDVVWDADLVATFDEDIAAGTGNIIITNLTDNTGTVIPVGDAQVTIVGATLTINPTASLDLGDDYAVRIDAGAIVDQAASPNAFAGIADNTTWNFTVASSIPITIANHSFETDIVTGNTLGGQPPANWSQSASVVYCIDRAHSNVSPAQPLPDGSDQMAMLRNQVVLFQVLTTKIAPNMTYTMTVDASLRSDANPTDAILRLGTGSTAGGNLLTADTVLSPAPAQTSWKLWQTTFTTGETVPDQFLRVEIYQAGGLGGDPQPLFDNVRLEAVPLPPSGTLFLFR